MIAAPATAQQMPGMAMPSAPASAPPATTAPTPTDTRSQAMGPMPGMGAGADPSGTAMAGMNMAGPMAGMTMQGMLGHEAMTRESSGTAWQPDSSPMRGRMFEAGGWNLMAEGWINGIYDHQGAPRGQTRAFSASMAMLMASRDVSEADRIGLRLMMSLDPIMGPQGYPLLFATGETADGRTPLIDRQHPHDLFMELAGSWAHQLGGGREVTLYAGLPGEPALGPPTFMHRISGMDDPEAPIGHHWFDSTHITYGVVTAGFSGGSWKIEASAFKGREPDQHRWNFETPRLDSWSVRASWNPTADLSLQLSTGHLHSPEQLEPDVDEQRTTASATYNKPLGTGRNWATTIAFSVKGEEPGPALTGFLAESALMFGRNEVYGRVEREDENELFGQTRQAGIIYPVEKLSLGYQRETPVRPHLFVAVGGLASAYAYPAALVPSYGGRGVKSFMLYVRLRYGS
ncbi:hypothetical protein [Sphingomonas bacterium]|uniref:hypothetical protein n=1 Tax=Sphingomonas bacterium TaxID=1895847 RepID=UPI001574FD99|nr:hypothetical protein [Sphingomonas bacterium]